MRRAGAVLVVAAALLLPAAGCGPRPTVPPRLTAASIAERHARALAERRAVTVAFDAEARVRVSGSAFGELPAVTALLALAGPDACRLRVRSLFGTALDVAARGDSIEAFVPSRGIALREPAGGARLGVRDPGGLAVRVWSAAWAPPAAAWAAGRWAGERLEVGWIEEGDTLSMAVDADGLPAEARLARPGGPALHAAYADWTRVAGAAWPGRVEFRDEAATVAVTVRVERARARRSADRGRVTPRIPEGAELLDWDDVRRALAREGEGE